MENLKSFFKKSELKFSGNLFGFGTSPEADWKVIFISSVILAILFVSFCVYIFIGVDKGEIFISEKPVGQEGRLFDSTSLKETVSYYQTKGLEFKEMKKVEISTVDPSL